MPSGKYVIETFFKVTDISWTILSLFRHISRWWYEMMKFNELIRIENSLRNVNDLSISTCTHVRLWSFILLGMFPDYATKKTYKWQTVFSVCTFKDMVHSYIAHLNNKTKQFNIWTRYPAISLTEIHPYMKTFTRAIMHLVMPVNCFQTDTTLQFDTLV